MKKYVFLIIMACLHAGISMYAQEVLSVSYKKANLKNVLKDIHNKTGLNFVADIKCLKNTNPITYRAENISLDTLLTIIFAEQPVTYHFIAKTIAIVPRNIQGRVIDQFGNPIPDVTVRASSQITQTDSKGEFVLRKASCEASIRFSYDRDSMTVQPRGQTFITVTMKTPHNLVAPL
jgi:hypothetical protein